MGAKISVILMAFIISLFVSACGSGSNNIDMKKLKETMQRDSTVSAEQKQEVRKSIFPNWNEKGN